MWSTNTLRTSTEVFGTLAENEPPEMTAMIEALFFLGPHKPVTWDEQSCIYCDSLRAAGNCLDTILALYTCGTGTHSHVNGP